MRGPWLGHAAAQGPALDGGRGGARGGQRGNGVVASGGSHAWPVGGLRRRARSYAGQRPGHGLAAV